MDQPNRGKVELVAGGKKWILTATTTELDNAESLLGVNGFDGVLTKISADDAPIKLLLQVAAIFLHDPAGEPGKICDEDLDEVLTEVGHAPFKEHLLRLCAATYGGREGMERFDRLRQLSADNRELALAEMEDATRKQFERATADPNAQRTEGQTA